MSRRFQFSLKWLFAIAIMFCLGQSPQGSAQTKQPAKAPDDQARPTPQLQIAETTLPTVKDAISKAIDHTKAYQLFLNDRIEIAAMTRPDGTIKVAFGRTTSGVVTAERRLPVKPIVVVQFTKDAVAAAQPENKGPAELQQRADDLANAVRAACLELTATEKMEFTVSVSKDDREFSVLVTRIPVTTGGHTLYRVSSDFHVVSTIHGR